MGGGAIWADLDRATLEHGLATTGGRVSTTGVAGLTLGGGSGWLERKHGLACDNLVAAELVTWDGRVVRASEDEHPELLWALRGGGGSFGVVTALELELHPVGPDVLGGLALFPIERAAEVLRVYRDVMHDAPDELSLAFGILTAPAEDDVPEHLHGRPVAAVIGMWAGDRRRRRGGAGADPRARPGGRLLRRHELRRLPVLARRSARLPQLVDGRERHRPARRGDRAHRVPRRRHPGRAVVQSSSSPGAARWRASARSTRRWPAASPASSSIPLMLWEDEADDAHCIAYARAVRADMEPWSTGATYPNFLGEEGTGRMSAAYGVSTERLAAVKRAWDPHGMFHTHQAVV